MAKISSNILDELNIFEVSYAGVPFLLDFARKVRVPSNYDHEIEESEQTLPRRFQSYADLIDQLDRMLPFQYLKDFGFSKSFLGRNISSVARNPEDECPDPSIKINDFYYPNTASRWSVFRGLATSSQVKAMLAISQYTADKFATFIMKCVPSGTPDFQRRYYTVATDMFMLPPRPLAEHGSQFDGLYLVTLVDERYFFHGTAIDLKITPRTTWFDLIYQLRNKLNIYLPDPIIPDIYGQPEVDSHMWSDWESAAVMLDAVAANLGSVIVRNLDHTFSFKTPLASKKIVDYNRGLPQNIRRYAGGELFNISLSGSISGYVLKSSGFANSGYSLSTSGTTEEERVLRTSGSFINSSGYSLFTSGTLFHTGSGYSAYISNTTSSGLYKVGNTFHSRNTAVPSRIHITYPKYIFENDPVPHFLNPRYHPSRPSHHYEDAYGESLLITFDITSGGPSVSGLTGQGDQTLHETAKALYELEYQAVYDQENPLNKSGLISLGLQLVNDYYDRLALVALDERYPGIYAWVPEGIHDIIWSYSAREGVAATRVLRTSWTNNPTEFQHSTPIISGGSITPPGVGGPSVAQTHRDSYQLTSGSTTPIHARVDGKILSGQMWVNPNDVSYFPTQNRWKAEIGVTESLNSYEIKSNKEIVLMEGMSGFASGILSGGGIFISGSISYPSPTNLPQFLPIVNSGWRSGLLFTIVYRGIDGTTNKEHGSGEIIKWIIPEQNYGINLVSHEKSQFIHPGLWTSGGIQESVVVPQTQTVWCTVNSGPILNDIPHYWGMVNPYDITKNSGYDFVSGEFALLIERNRKILTSGKRYDGQFIGYSKSIPKSGLLAYPTYAVSESTADTCKVAGVYCQGNVLIVIYDDANCIAAANQPQYWCTRAINVRGSETCTYSSAVSCELWPNGTKVGDTRWKYLDPTNPLCETQQEAFMGPYATSENCQENCK